MFSELETEERRSQQRRLRRHREAERTLGGPNVLRAKKKKKTSFRRTRHPYIIHS